MNLKAISIMLMAFFISFNPNNSLAQSNFKKFFKLSCPEKRWVLFHPFIANSAYKISIEAQQKANELKTDSALDGDLNGGQLDAFRHAYRTALITQKHGWRKALSLGKAHEKGNYKDYKKHRDEDGILPDAQSCDMDFLNNDVGIQIGKDNSKASCYEISDVIKNEIINGKLFVLRKDFYGNFLDCNNEIIMLNNFKGKWETPKCIVPSNKVKNY